MVLIAVLTTSYWRTNVFRSTTGRNCALQPKRWMLYDFHEQHHGKHHAVTVWWDNTVTR